MKAPINQLKNKAAKYLNDQNWMAAASIFKELCEIEPSIEHMSLLASAYFSAEKFQEALAVYQSFEHDESVKLPRLLINQGSCHEALGNKKKALKQYLKALKLEPTNVQIILKASSVLRALRHFDEAETLHKKALSQSPDDYELHLGLANIYKEWGRSSQALRQYELANRLCPNNRLILFNTATIHEGGSNYETAIKLYRKCIEIDPEFAEPFERLGLLFSRMNQPKVAIRYFEQALKLDPLNHNLYNAVALCFVKTKRFDKALKIYKQALDIEPNHKMNCCHYVQLRTLICDFSLYSDPYLINGKPEDQPLPFAFLAVEDNPAKQKARSQALISHLFSGSENHRFEVPSKPKEKITIGYFSADFKEHATLFLLKRVLELHNKSRYKVILYSYSNTSDEYDQNLAKTLGHELKNVSSMSDSQVVALARNDGLDIAVDLKGFTESSRLAIFAHRVAPIQVNFLGYPGSSGAEWMDYIVADNFVILEQHEQHYTEKIARLPNSYQPNDETRDIWLNDAGRAEFGLPDNKIVFCCFNQNYKVTPAEISVWSDILHQVPNSIIWFYRSNSWAEASIRRAFRERNISTQQVVFSAHVAHKKHLSRYRHADLFLDTFNVNAHTTASDALWAGVPLITKPGHQFAARVAGSLAIAAGIPEVIVSTQKEYIDLAVELALDNTLRTELRQKLQSQRDTCPLFDSRKYTHDLESLYEAMFETWIKGRPLENLTV